MTVPSSGTERNGHVQAFSPTDAWAVGIDFSRPQGSGRHRGNWNGSTWTPVATPVSTTNNLSINAISGYVGQRHLGGRRDGDARLSQPPVHIRDHASDGSSWTQMPAPDNSGLLDVDAGRPETPGDRGRRLRAELERTAWSVAAKLAQGNTAIAALRRRDVLVAGVVSLTHYNGTSWASASDPAGVNALTGHAVLSPGDIWFAGYYYPSNAVRRQRCSARPRADASTLSVRISM